MGAVRREEGRARGRPAFPELLALLLRDAVVRVVGWRGARAVQYVWSPTCFSYICAAPFPAWRSPISSPLQMLLRELAAPGKMPKSAWGIRWLMSATGIPNQARLSNWRALSGRVLTQNRPLRGGLVKGVDSRF